MEIPHSSQVRDPDFVANVRPRAHRFDPAGLAVRDRAIRRFDAAIHDRIDSAKTMGEWEKLADDLVAAHKLGYKDVKGLRTKVLEHFVEGCPFGPVKRRYYEGVKAFEDVKNNFYVADTGRQPQGRKGPSPERLQKLATRREHDTKDRAAKKTVGGGGGQKQGNGNKNKK